MKMLYKWLVVLSSICFLSFGSAPRELNLKFEKKVKLELDLPYKYQVSRKSLMRSCYDKPLEYYELRGKYKEQIYDISITYSEESYITVAKEWSDALDMYSIEVIRGTELSAIQLNIFDNSTKRDLDIVLVFKGYEDQSPYTLTFGITKKDNTSVEVDIEPILSSIKSSKAVRLP